MADTGPLRQVAIEAARAALLAEQWDHSNPTWAHSNHRYHAFCAICAGDLDRILPIALDAADRALAEIADPSPEQALLDALGLLRVTTDGPGAFTVDAETLTCCDRCVRFWHLVETPTGKWRHPGSGVEDRLLLVLRSIAQHYLDHRHDHEAVPRG